MHPKAVQKQKDKKQVIFRLFILLVLSLRSGGVGSLSHKTELYDVPIVDGRIATLMGRAWGGSYFLNFLINLSGDLLP